MLAPCYDNDVCNLGAWFKKKSGILELLGIYLTRKLLKGRENHWKIQRFLFSLIADFNAQSGGLDDW